MSKAFTTLFLLIAATIASFAPPFYLTNDPKWSTVTLGSSSYYMRTNGQLICSIASGLAWKGVSTRDGLVNPNILNSFIQARTDWDGTDANFPYSVLEELGYYLDIIYTGPTYDLTDTQEISSFILAKIDQSIILAFCNRSAVIQPTLLYAFIFQQAIIYNPSNVSDVADPIAGNSFTSFIALSPLQNAATFDCDDLCYLNPCNCPLFPCSIAQGLKDSCMVYAKGLITGCSAGSTTDSFFFECALNGCPCAYAYIDPNKCPSLSEQSSQSQHQTSTLIGIGLDLYVWIDIFVPNANLPQTTIDALRTQANASTSLQEIVYNRVNISITEMQEISQQAIQVASQEISDVLSSYSQLPISVQQAALAIYIQNYRRKEYLVTTDLWGAFDTMNYNYIYKLLNQIPSLYDYYSEVYCALEPQSSDGFNITEYSLRTNGQSDTILFPNGGYGGWEDRTSDYVSFPSLALQGIKVPKYAGEAVRYALNCDYQDTIANVFIMIDNAVYGDYTELNLYTSFLQDLFTRDPITSANNITWWIFGIGNGLVSYLDAGQSITVVKNALKTVQSRLRPLLTQSNLTNTFNLLINNYNPAQNNTNVVLYLGVGNPVNQNLSYIQLLKEQYGFHFIVLSGDSQYRDLTYLRSLSSDYLVYNLEAVNYQSMPTTLLRSISEGIVRGSVDGTFYLEVSANSYRYLSFPLATGGNYIQITQANGNLQESDINVYAAISIRNPTETAYEFLGVYSNGQFLMSYQFPGSDLISNANCTSASISGFLYVSILPSISGVLQINSSENSTQLASCGLGCLSCDNTGTACYICDADQQFSTLGDNCTSPLLQTISFYSDNFKIYNLPQGENDVLYTSVSIVVCLFCIIIVVALTTRGRVDRYAKEKDQSNQSLNIMPESPQEQISSRNASKRIDLSMLRSPRFDFSLNPAEN